MTIAKAVAASGADALRGHLFCGPPPLPLCPQRSDYDLNPDALPAGPRELTPAAVLVPIIRRAEPTILFTRRTAHLARHAGQVSFPGGRLHADDASLAATALRETREETGIASALVTIAGFLECYETVTGFAILPVVGVVSPEFVLEPDPGEVAETFEVPLAFLMDGQNCRQESRVLKGRSRRFYAFTYEDQCIWGATAAILVSLRDRLCGGDSEP